MQLGLACVILVAIHPIIQWRPQVGHFQIAKPVPHDTLDWHAPANYKAHCRFAIYPRQPPRCNFLSFITTAANCAMLETLAPFAANGRPAAPRAPHGVLMNCSTQTRPALPLAKKPQPSNPPTWLRVGLDMVGPPGSIAFPMTGGTGLCRGGCGGGLSWSRCNLGAGTFSSG